MNKIIKSLLLLMFIYTGQVMAQYGVDISWRRIGYHNGNRAGISFYNDGQIAGYNVGTDIRGEWPLGSGYNYIGDLIPLIGVEFVNLNKDTLHSVCISRGPRQNQSLEEHPELGYFWGFNAVAGYLNPNYESVAMSHLPESWPLGGWPDPGGFPEVKNYVDEEGNTEWWGYFGRGIINADQESYFVAWDQSDDEFNQPDNNDNATLFIPDSTDPKRHGMGLQLRQRGFQWSSFLAEDVIFWLYDIKNEGTTTYKKANFGTVVGTLAGGDGDSGDDLGFFDSQDWITYSWDNDNVGNEGQEVGYVGYAYLESPGNPYDGIDNDGDSEDPASPQLSVSDFDEITYNAGDRIILIDEDTYERSYFTIEANTDTTLLSLGTEFHVYPGMTVQEGHAENNGGVWNPDTTAVDGIDNDLDGLIDENIAIHVYSRIDNGNEALRYTDYFSSLEATDPLIDERRDNDIDEDGDWSADYDDLGTDGLGPDDDGYPGPDLGEDDGVPTQGEPNFGRTDPDESDQIGLTSFNFFNINEAPDMDNDADLWLRMVPGAFDVVSSQPQDGDFIYASGYFPLPASNEDLNITGIERFSVSLLFGEDRRDIFSNKSIVQQIYNAGYKFPQPPKKPTVTLAQEDGNVVIYWDGEESENSRDFITKDYDFQGYKIYRATDDGFQDARTITNARGVLSFDKPIAQYDLDDGIEGYFYPSYELLSQIGGVTFNLGEDTGLINKFVDSTVTAGQTYYYAVCAYDRGADSLDIFPSENSKFIYRENTGEVTTDINTGVITPGVRPAGYKDAEYTDFVKSSTYRATGSAYLDMIDDASVKDGYSYKIVFTDTTKKGLTETWSLIDLQRPDSVYISEINTSYLVSPGDSVTIPADVDTIRVNGIKVGVNGLTSYKAEYDTLINKSTKFSGETPIRDGFRVQIQNDWRVKIDSSKSGFEGIGSDPAPTYNFYEFTRNAAGPLPAVRNNGIPNNYQVEFFDEVVGQSVADTLSWPPVGSNLIPAKDVNFKVKNLTTDQYVNFSYWTFGNFSTTHTIVLKEPVQGEYLPTWRIEIFYDSLNAPIENSGTLSLSTLKPFSSVDELTFTMESAYIDKDAASASLDDIKVVPNPYVVTHAAEAKLLSTQSSGRGEREIWFTKVPPDAKISIYTVRGDLIKTLHHNDLYQGNVTWNLRTEENIDVAFGVYVFVVEVPNIGTKIGKFALIK